MSMRSLIEINHDFSFKLDDLAFLTALQSYLASGSRENAQALERFGVRVVGMRHHSENYIVDGKAEGFPPRYLDPPKPLKDTTANV